MHSQRSSHSFPETEVPADKANLLLLRAARQRAAGRPAGQTGPPDYGRLAEAFRRHTALDEAGLGPELARLRNAIHRAPPRPPTLWGRAMAALGGLLSPVLWRLMRALGVPNPFDAVYEALLRDSERQLAAEERIHQELEAIRARLEELEAAHRNGRPVH